MMELLTAAQMRGIETAAIEAGDVTGLDLMESAGRGLVEAVLEWRPALATAPHRAVMLCGPGNNGGDGFVVARLLKDRGWQVRVFLYGRDPAEIARLPPDAAQNARRWREMGSIEPFAALADETKGCDLTIDALFGTGLVRPLDGAAIDAVERFSRDDDGTWIAGLTVAVDIPSGVCADSGRALGEARRSLSSELVVTFHRPKIGHLVGPTHGSAAELRCVDIGLQASGAARARTQEGDLVRKARPLSSGRLSKASHDHKYTHGHALILSGGVGKGGAARMAARGALRIGAGLVTVGCPPAALQENASALDAVMLRAFARAEALGEFLTGRKVNAVCIGPGFGHGERLRAFVAAALATNAGRGGGQPHSAERLAVLLDADAISEFADDPQALFPMLHPACVLTPHQGEFGRLFPDLLEKLTAPAIRGPAYSKVDATREAAARAGCVVLFKGPDTVIADPQGRCVVSSAAGARAAPWLATAGTGDVLAGFLTGLMARGFGAFEAAETAAWLHVECALHFGPGLIAEDLPEQVPAVFRKLEM